MRNTPGYDPQREMHNYDPQREVLGYEPQRGTPDYQDSPYQRPAIRQDMSSASLAPLGAAAFPAGNGKRTSMLNLSNSQSDRNLPIAAGGVGGAAAAGGIMGTLGGLVGKGGTKQYDPVSGPYNPGEYNLGETGTGQEKSEWLAKQKTGSKKLKILVIILACLALLGAIAGGIVGGILGSQKKSAEKAANGPSGASAAEDNKSNGDLSKDSTEIKALLNNKNLHKVFPGIDYTPMYTQYPDCLHYPASQNNVTRDVAVLSQLSNTIRLYGTDCNQTQMVLHAIDRLGLNGTTKIWMGVWQDKNATTNARQLQQMYDIFDSHGSASFVGVIVGNEVLFREDMTITELGTVLENVKSNLTTRGISIPVASADLGDKWTQPFADQVDILMANIHPFFAGEESTGAAAWTWQFWQNKDVPFKPDLSKNYISETGWPAKGGKSCGEATTCAVGSVAGITELNNFMDDWVCGALANGTNYFWFEAFDEPWKIKFNEPGKEWEDQWGLMDVNRVLKSGVKIPDCGGKTAP
ncbi:putative glucan endo-1,3-beta-glucosidase btgC [Glarea lozoyensis 74030]|uniref:glucan endo-1,3-beta-D-glucosidase n=1 Tax=Glarea lozoyensis (strain ATCC 74030 / MF5533) TaxID=1104152 RepID=H0EMS7_GLAL7|nr:putative glucan endo-1,3-beta-glucosidase btgC [Glarea lozoyensis 74030]